MAFLSSAMITEIGERRPLVLPWDPSRIQDAAYELTVGRQYFCTSMNGGRELVPEGGQLVIPPGQLALLITDEKVDIPASLIGLISIKFSAKIRGLINVSGFHVDPGFRGRLKFSVYNAGSRDAIFDPGQSLFSIWFAELKGPEQDPYNGSHQGQTVIAAADVVQVQGAIASPGALKKQFEELRASQKAGVDKLEHQLKLVWSVLLLLLGLLLSQVFLS